MASGQPESASQLLRCLAGRRLQQPERVAASFREHLVPDRGVNRTYQPRIQQGARILLGQAGDRKLRHPGEVLSGAGLT